MMVELYHRVLDEFGKPTEWAVHIVVPIFKWMGDGIECTCCDAVKFFYMV